MLDNMSVHGKTKAPAVMQVLLAPEGEEYLNRVWRDFRKVVHFIEENEKWLLLMLEQVSKNSRG